MTDLAGFLLARIAEDEAVARAALAWQRADPADRWRDADGAVEDGQGQTLASYVGDDVAPHIARWDPARVLAECEADRRIVAEHAPTEHDSAEREMSPGYCRMCVGENGWPIKEGQLGVGVKAPCQTLRLLALPYAGHEAYREEWRP